MQNLYFQPQYPPQNLSSTFQIPALILPNNLPCFPYSRPSSNPPKLSCFDSSSFYNSNLPEIPALKLSEAPNYIYQPEPQPMQYSQISQNIETPINPNFIPCQTNYNPEYFQQYNNPIQNIPVTQDNTPYYNNNCQFINPIDNIDNMGFSQQIEEPTQAEFTVDDFLTTERETSQELASPGLAPSCSKNLMEVSNLERVDISLLELPNFVAENRFDMMMNIENKELLSLGIERTMSNMSNNNTLKCDRNISSSRKKRKVDQDNEVWVKDENLVDISPPSLKMKKSKSEFHKRKYDASPNIKREISLAQNLRGGQYDQTFQQTNLPFIQGNNLNGDPQVCEKLEDLSTDISSMQVKSTDSPQFMKSCLNILPAITPSILCEENTQSLISRFHEYFHNGPSLVGLNQTTTGNNTQPKQIGTLTVEERKAKIDKYLEKRKKRTWNKKISYDCRKRVADSRLRVKGRFITKNQAFEILRNDGVEYDPNTITMEEIREYLTQKYGDHSMEPHPFKEDKTATSWGDTESDEMFNFTKKESEEDDDFNSYFNMKGDFAMSPLKFMDMAESFLM